MEKLDGGGFIYPGEGLHIVSKLWTKTYDLRSYRIRTAQIFYESCREYCLV